MEAIKPQVTGPCTKQRNRNDCPKTCIWTCPPGVCAFWGKISSAHDDGEGKNLWINCDDKGHLFTIRRTMT